MEVQGIDPTISVAQAAEMLEQRLQQQFGPGLYERLSQTVTLRLGERTRTEQQFFSMVIFMGQAQDQLSLALIWLARKRFPRSPLAQQFLDEVRAAPVGWVLQNACETVQAAREEANRKGDV